MFEYLKRSKVKVVYDNVSYLVAQTIFEFV